MNADTKTLQLFPDFSGDRKAAIEVDVAAAGGLQEVGMELGLADNPIDAGKLLSNRINRNGRHRLTDDDVWRIRELARERAGVSRLHELESGKLNYEGRWLTTEDIKARRKKRISALMAALQVELAQDNDEVTA